MASHEQRVNSQTLSLFVTSFLNTNYYQGPTIYLGVKDASLVSLLVFLLLLKSAGALFLGKRLGLLRGLQDPFFPEGLGDDWLDLPRYLYRY